MASRTISGPAELFQATCALKGGRIGRNCTFSFLFSQPGSAMQWSLPVLRLCASWRGRRKAAAEMTLGETGEDGTVCFFNKVILFLLFHFTMTIKHLNEGRALPLGVESPRESWGRKITALNLVHLFSQLLGRVRNRKSLNEWIPSSLCTKSPFPQLGHWQTENASLFFHLSLSSRQKGYWRYKVSWIILLGGYGVLGQLSSAEDLVQALCWGCYVVPEIKPHGSKAT